MPRTKTIQVFFLASITVFFIQGLRVLFSVLFGIIYDQVFEGPIDSWLVISNLLALLTLLVPAILPRKISRNWLFVFSILAVVARLSLTVNDATIRYWGSLATVAFSGLYLAGVLQADRSLFLTSMVGGFMLDQLLRVVGQTYDLSLRPSWFPAQAVWAGVMVVLGFWLTRKVEVEEDQHGGLGWQDGLAVGGFLFLETSLLSLPNAIARWSGVIYPLIAPLLLAISLVPLFPIVRERIWQFCQLRISRWGLAGGLVIGLLLGYFTTGIIAGLALIIAQVAILAGMICILGGISGGSTTTGRKVAIGLVFFLLLTFLNAFAFTYPYVLPVMRGLGWLVYLLATSMVVLAMIRREDFEEAALPPMIDTTIMGVLTLATLAITILVVWPQPATPLSVDRRLRAATYNIHYGYDDDWHFMIEEMAQTIAASDIDVIALQEVDAGRITSYSVDDAHYLASRLRMNVAYLPTVEHLTGIAVLYRGPVAQVEQALLTSVQEQTGIVGVTLDVLGRSVHSYGIWLGLSNEDTMRQISEALDFIGSKEPTTFAGDFNAKPDDPESDAIRDAGFLDPFLALNIDPPPLTSPAIEPKSRIDHVWLRDLTPILAWVSGSLASDHRMVIVEVRIP